MAFSAQMMEAAGLWVKGNSGKLVEFSVFSRAKNNLYIIHV
tara:strand:- start:50 stop:172 length:123 start_codon:yes stop_codon:yes gene_type:complete